MTRSAIPKCAAVLVITAALLLGSSTTQRAQANGKGPCSEHRYEIRQGMSSGKIVARNRALIRCAFTWAGIPGSTESAWAIADRESNYLPWAKNPWVQSACQPYSANPYGSCGTFQHLARYWPSRVQRYVKSWWFPHRFPQVEPRNERANALVSAQMWRAQGGACPAWCF